MSESLVVTNSSATLALWYGAQLASPDEVKNLVEKNENNLKGKVALAHHSDFRDDRGEDNEETDLPRLVSEWKPELLIWFSGSPDFPFYPVASGEMNGVKIWKCRRESLVGRFGELARYLAGREKGEWKPDDWFRPSPRLRALALLCKGYVQLLETGGGGAQYPGKGDGEAVERVKQRLKKKQDWLRPILVDVPSLDSIVNTDAVLAVLKKEVPQFVHESLNWMPLEKFLCDRTWGEMGPDKAQVRALWKLLHENGFT